MKAILTINFNGARLLQKQVELLRRFVKGEFDFFVGDNSKDPYQSESIQRICEDSKSTYIKLSIREGDPSRHNGLALNECLSRLKEYDQVLIIDHDCFPFKEADIFNKYLDFDFAGIHQLKGNDVYIAPIFCLVNNFKNLDYIDMLPSRHMDTGGAMMEILLTKKVKFVNEFLIGEGLCYYAEVDDSFMHFVKGSGWDGNPNHEVRINLLYEKLEELIHENSQKAKS